MSFTSHDQGFGRRVQRFGALHDGRAQGIGLGHQILREEPAQRDATAIAGRGRRARQVGAARRQREQAQIGRRAVQRDVALAAADGRLQVVGGDGEIVDGVLYVSTYRDSRKTRNVAATGRAGVSIAVRRIPFGPPASIQFQTMATVLDNDDPEIVALVEAGRFGKITAHRELELPGACFLRIPLPSRAVTYALGMSLWHVMRHPLVAAGQVELRPTVRT